MRRHSLALAAILLLAVLPQPAALAGNGEAPPERRFVDGAGRTISLRGVPRRLVSLAPSVTEMLLALDLAPRLVGASDFCVLPDEARPVTRIGGLINPDLEAIVALKPDLAVATTSGNYLEDADRIAALGIPVYTTDTPTVEAVLSTLEELGRILGVEAAARALVSDLGGRLERIGRALEGRRRPRVLFIVWGDPVLVPGRGAFINDALARAGADSISREAPARWAEIGLEQVISGAPEVILTVPDNRAFAESIAGDPRWEAVPAVRDGRIHVVGNAIQQPGPGIVDGILEVARLLHPGAGLEGPTGTFGEPPSPPPGSSPGDPPR